MRTRLFITPALTLLWFTPFAAALVEDKEDLLKRATNAHRSAIELIRTFSCRVDFEKKGLPNPGHVDYWRSGDMVRVVEEFSREPSEILVRNGKKIRINRNPKLDVKKDMVAIISAKKREHDGVGDAWELGLMKFLGPKRG